MVCRVEGKEITIIPPLTSVMIPDCRSIWCRNLTESGYVESVQNAHTYLTIPGIIRTNTESKFINVINHNEQELTLYHRQIIGTCESYVDDTMDMEQIRSTTRTRNNDRIYKE